MIRESGRTPTHNSTMAIELLIKFGLNNGAEKVLENIEIKILALTCFIWENLYSGNLYEVFLTS